MNERRVVFLSVTVVVLAVVVSTVSAYKVLQKYRTMNLEAVWIARYMKVSDYDLKEIVDVVNMDRGLYITSTNWLEVDDQDKEDSQIVVFRSSSQLFGYEIEITKDTSVHWVEVKGRE